MKKTTLYSLLISSAICFSGFEATAMIGEGDEEAIRIYPKTFSAQNKEKNNLIVSSALNDVEFLSIDQGKKLLTLYRKGENPIEIEKGFQPSLPWDLPQDQFEQVVTAHTFNLKQLDDGSYAVNKSIPGLGGGLLKKFLKKVNNAGKKVINTEKYYKDREDHKNRKQERKRMKHEEKMLRMIQKNEEKKRRNK